MMTAYFSSEFVQVRRTQQHLKSAERKACPFENSVKMPFKNKGETALFQTYKNRTNISPTKLHYKKC